MLLPSSFLSTLLLELVRVSPNGRAGRPLGEPSVAHLAKSLLLASTAHRPPPPDALLTPKPAAALAPHVLAIAQYVKKKLDAEKLRRHLVAAADGAAPAKALNTRLAPLAVSDGVTGCTHNAVTPVGQAKWTSSWRWTRLSLCRHTSRWCWTSRVSVGGRRVELLFFKRD